MSIAGFSTSSDIYLEVNGVKAAVVQSYTARASKTSRAVEAFGEEEPVATVPGQSVPGGVCLYGSPRAEPDLADGQHYHLRRQEGVH